MPNTVKKAVIPVAGLGTRFLPATKTVPKELFPLVDKPILLFIIEEAVRAGIEDIVLVAGRGKTAIEDFFDTSYELEDKLAKGGKEDLLHEVRRIKSLANIISIRQLEAGGLGHAVLASRPVVGDEPFAVLLGDELTYTRDGEPTVTGKLVNCFKETGVSTVAVMEVEPQEVKKYGIVAYSGEKDGLYKVTSVVEKPQPEAAPSRLALPGRYVFSSAIYGHLQKVKPGVIGEIQLTDGMTMLAEQEGLYATTFSARRYDAGDKFGYLQANIELGLEHPEIGSKLKSYLKDLAKGL
ncbi:MAG: UTP--glucose-1-phosphate uridylyltransferase GalU [Bdellovibrionaceae bacterium]|nr:UTP--glucose-1-phosphate uridylyltransferase GalU [Bdellovibrionales bacterium]MCB9085550.1 UTP--glucose-1-phosphate uridylyltransferase GalU [Pseudobdellovibrionaceae bacterium]